MNNQHELIQIRFAHWKHGIHRVRWSDLPAEAPLTWYHLCEHLEHKFLLVSGYRSFSSVDSAFVAIHASQVPHFEDERKTKQNKFVLLDWLTQHCISPFLVFDSRDCSLVLFRLTRSQRLALFNQRCGPKWVYKFQSLYKDYEQEVSHSDSEVTQHHISEPSIEQDKPNDDESEIVDFLEQTKSDTIQTERFRFRVSYMVDHIGVQKKREKLRHESTQSVPTNLTIIDEPTETRVRLRCKRIVPNLPFGILRRDLVEVNEKNYRLYFHKIDFDQMIVYQEAESDTAGVKQYVTKPDIERLSNVVSIV